MLDLRYSAVSLATIMILSTMSGFVYDDVSNSEEFILEFIAHTTSTDAEEISELFSHFECQFDDIEDCEILYDYGESHNKGLYSLGLAAEESGIEIGTTPDKDLLLYDRLVMSSKNPEVIGGYDKMRDIFAKSFELATYTENDSVSEKKANIINTTVGGLDSFCEVPMNGMFAEGDYSGERGSKGWQVCVDMVDEVKPVIQLALDDVFSEESGTTAIHLLSPSDELSNQSIVLLHMLQAIGHASSLFWLCSDHAEPNAGDLVEAGGKERITWCGQYENSGEEDQSSSDDGTEEASTMARGGHLGFYSSLTKEQKKNFWIDIAGALAFLVVAISAIVAIVGTVVVTGGTVLVISMNVLLANLGALGAGVYYIIHFLHSVFGIHVVHDDDHGNSSTGTGNSGSGGSNPPADQLIGDVSILGANYVSFSHSQTGVGFVDCPYSYEAQLAGSSSNLQQNLLSYSWNYATIPAMQPGLTGWIHQQDSVDTTARFFQQGDYLVLLTVSHPHATDSPQTVSFSVSASHRCGDDVPMDTDYDSPNDDTWSQVVPTTPTMTGEKWYDSAIRDLGLTMKHDDWMKTRNCGEDDWNCHAATVVGIQHNNWLGSFAKSQAQLGIGLDVASPGIMSNMDAIVVHSNSPTTLFAYMHGRDRIETLQTKLTEELQDRENYQKSMNYLVVKVNVDIASENRIPEKALLPLKHVLDNWDEETADDLLMSELEKAIENDDGEDPIVTQLLQYQLAVGHASGAMDEDSFARAWSWKKAGDVAGVIGGALLTGTGYGMGVFVALKAGSSLFSNSGVEPGQHTGFNQDDVCAINQLPTCIQEKLAENNNFATERAAAANAVNTCGEDPTLTTLETAVQKDFYIAGDPIEWTLTVNCAILDYEYQIKTEVIQSLTGDVAYGEKTEWWVQTNTDYTTTFNMRIDNGLDIGEYCVNSLLIEAFNPVIVASSSGTGTGYCFDVDPARSDGSGDGTGDGDSDDDDEDEDDGWPIPGFTGMTAFIAMLGAAIVAFRRLEDQ